MRTPGAGHSGRSVAAYCNAYGESLLEGWGRRQSEWQLGIGIQHEILPRLSGEVTYNRRMYANLQVSDQLGVGCDRFNGVGSDITTCQQSYLDFTSPSLRLLLGDSRRLIRAFRTAAAIGLSD